MAPSKSERGRRNNTDQIPLPLVNERKVVLSNRYSHEVVVTEDNEGTGHRFLQIKDLTGSVVRLVPLTIEDDIEDKLSLELDKLEGRGNRGRGGVFTNREL